MKKTMIAAFVAGTVLVNGSFGALIYSQPFYQDAVANRPMQEYGWTTLNESVNGVVEDAVFPAPRYAIGVGRGNGAPDVGAVDAIWPEAIDAGLRGYPYMSTSHADLSDYSTDSSCLTYTTISTDLTIDSLGKLSLEQRADNTDSIIRFAIKIGEQWYASAEEFGGQNANWTLKEMEESDFTDASKWVEISITADAITLGAAPATALSGTIAAYGVFLNTGVTPTPGDHARIDNFQVYSVDVQATYVASVATDWTDPAAWSDGLAAAAGTTYYASNSVVLNTPASAATFPGVSLNLFAPQRLEIMTSGTNATTIANLSLDAADLGAGLLGTGEAQIDGNITVTSNSTFSGATDNSRDLRILSKVVGEGEVSLELSAPTKTIYIDNTANTFSGTWVVADGAAEFAAGAVGSASIRVQSNGTLRILGDWNGLSTVDSLTVADSPNALVELGTNTWTVSTLTIGSSNVLVGFTYDAAELSAIGDAVFTGSGSIQIGVPYVPPQLLHHWAFDEGTGDVAVDSAGSNDGVILNASWSSDGERASYLSFNGTDSSVDPSVAMAVPSAGNGETWACWVLDPSSSANNNDIILGSRGAGAADFGKLIPYPTGGGRLGYRNDVLQQYSFNDGNVSLGRDVWQHVAFVRDGTNATFYVNGVQVNDSPFVLSLDNASALPFFMGGEPGLGTGEHFEGGIDEVVLYNYALTASQVVDVMNGIFPGIDMSNAITAYSFDPSGTSSLSFTGAVSSAYVIKSTGSLPFGGYTTVTPTAAAVGSLDGDVITTDGSGAATAEFTEPAPEQFYKVESAP